MVVHLGVLNRRSEYRSYSENLCECVETSKLNPVQNQEIMICFKPKTHLSINQQLCMKGTWCKEINGFRGFKQKVICMGGYER